jgi:ribosomal protein L27
MITYLDFLYLIQQLNNVQVKPFELRLDNFATKGTARKTKNGRDSGPKHYGLKKSDGQIVRCGNIISKTCNRFVPGKGVGKGKDYTIFCMEEYGIVKFTKKRKLPMVKTLKRIEQRRYNTVINVQPITVEEYLAKVK